MIIPMRQVMYSKSPISPSILLFKIVACLPFYNYFSVLHLKTCLSIYIKHMHTHNCFVALWILSRQPGWDGTIRNIHPLTPIVVINHPLSASSIQYDPWHLPGAPDSLSTIPLQVSIGLPLGLAPPFHTPYISSGNHCLLFAAHTSTKIVI